MYNSQRYSDTDSDIGDPFGHCSENNQPLSLLRHPDGNKELVPAQGAGSGGGGTQGKNFMVISTLAGFEDGIGGSGSSAEKPSEQTGSFTSMLNSADIDPEPYVKMCSAYLLQFLSSSQRLFGFLMGILFLFYLYPTISLIFVSSILLVLLGGHQNNNTVTTRSARWTITGFSYQMKDGFLASPAFLDKTGQWRMTIKQKRGVDGCQTCFGLMCTDLLPDVDVVTTNVTFHCTNQFGQELSTGGMRNLSFQSEYQCPGDIGFSRPIRLQRKQLGVEETITLHCKVEFHKKAVTFMKTLARNIRDGENAEKSRKGKNIVTEHGTVFPGELEFQDVQDSRIPSAFRAMARFANHSETRTYIWEIPDFTTILENSELWGIFSPQFFLTSHDVCSIWRMKLFEAQGVFRLHVQLRGLPRAVKQVKLWYLLQLVDNYGDSVIPEHAVNRVKYPDHMNLWDTTRHILYRRETILERFVTPRGSLTLRVSLQMEPNDMTLMGVDSDEWIGGGLLQDQQAPCGLLHDVPGRSRAITN